MTKSIPQPVNQTAPSPHELMRQTQREIAEAVMNMKAKQIECLIGLYRKSDALEGTDDLGEMYRRTQMLSQELDLDFSVVQKLVDFGFNCGVECAASIASSAGAMEKVLGKDESCEKSPCSDAAARESA
ncbi:hypothetical protein KUL113_03800 [Tenacibaculum sp. KUL113]|nr:hypothetical protein KUL113_03800 [Tenacibaculum sp. KUL113]